MARLTKITRRNPISSFREVTPVAGAGFGLLAEAMNTAYERVLPAALEEAKRRGTEAGLESAGDTSVTIEGGIPAPNVGMGPYRDAIASIESAGSGDYRAVGPRHAKLGRALGRYQIMEANLPKWSRDALGREVSADEFLANDDIQDAIFDHRFGGYLDRFGHEGAAQAWFAGPGGVGKVNRKDSLGTTVGEYTRRFNAATGSKAVVKSGAVNVSTRGPTVTVRNSKGGLEQRLYSQFSGPTLQAYNAAAKTAYQAEVLNRSSVDLLGISQGYPTDPDGFSSAAKGYVDQIVGDAPADLRPALRQSLNQEVSRRTMGLMSEKQQDIENRANNSSRALVERYQSELSDAIISGDQEQITAAELKLDDILQAREALPGVAWTDAQSANVFSSAQKVAEREIERRRSAASSQTKSDLNTIIKFAKNGLTAEQEGILSDPDLTSLHPELAREAQAFVNLRDQLPEIQQMTPDQMDVAVVQMKDAELSEPWQLDVINAAEDIAKDNREAWDADPVKRASEILDTPPPELPQLSADDPEAFTGALGARIEYMDEVFGQGFTNTRAYLSEQEAEDLGTIMGKETPPEIRAAVAAAVVAGAGPAAVQIFDELDGDSLTAFAGKMMAVGGNANLATEILRGQQIMDEGIADLPESGEVREVFNSDFSEAFQGIPGSIEAQSEVMDAARAIYAARSRGANLDKAGQEQLLRESMNAALGAGKNKRGEATGGVQDVMGHQTLLPVGINGAKVDEAVRRAFGTTRFSSGGIKAGISRTGATQTPSTEAWEKASAQGAPTFRGEPIPQKLVRGGALRVIAAGQNGYRMELTVGDTSYDISDADGMVYFFDLQVLMDETR